MAVNIDVFFSERNRPGAIPSIPSVPSTEVPPVLNPEGTNITHPPVTLGSPANGLSLSGQELSLGLASAGVTGALSGTDWSTFNGKLNLTSPITGYTVGANNALADTDTILQAFGKVQGQINGKIGGSGTVNYVPKFTESGTIGSSLISEINGDIFVNVSPSGAIRGVQIGEGVNRVINMVMTIGGSFTVKNGGAIYLERNGGANVIFARSSNTNFDLDIFTPAISTGNLNFRKGDSSILAQFDVLNSRLSINTTSPTNTLDVNGTARIRTVANATGNFVTLSATGVLQQRTAAEVATDIGAIVESTQVVTTTGTINNLVSTASTIAFTGSGTVTLTGIVALANGRELTLINLTGNTLTMPNSSVSSSVGNRFFFVQSVPNRGTITIKYSTDGGNAWFLKAGNFYSTGNEVGAWSLEFLGIGRTPDSNIPISVRTNSNTNTAFAWRSQRLDTTVTSEIRNLDAQFYVPTSFGPAAIRTERDFGVLSRPPSGTFGFSYIIQNQSGTLTGSFEKNGDFITTRPIYIGAPDWFNATPSGSRAIIRGAGTGTTNTLLLEDSTGADLFAFLDNGNLSIPSANGAIIATSTTQKLGIWGKTPIVQPTTAIAAAAFVANTSGIVNDTATFGGYTLGQVVQALRNIGILA